MIEIARKEAEIKGVEIMNILLTIINEEIKIYCKILKQSRELKRSSQKEIKCKINV